MIPNGSRQNAAKYGGGYCGQSCGAWRSTLPRRQREGVRLADGVRGSGTMNARCCNPVASAEYGASAAAG